MDSEREGAFHALRFRTASFEKRLGISCLFAHVESLVQVLRRTNHGTDHTRFFPVAVQRRWHWPFSVSQFQQRILTKYFGLKIIGPSSSAMLQSEIRERIRECTLFGPWPWVQTFSSTTEFVAFCGTLMIRIYP
eukprot:SAG11_NODE_1627_length_4552_cov_4.548619_6_plen_134_part_00